MIVLISSVLNKSCGGKNSGFYSICDFVRLSMDIIL